LIASSFPMSYAEDREEKKEENKAKRAREQEDLK
jgi:hypothetical protein